MTADPPRCTTIVRILRKPRRFCRTDNLVRPRVGQDCPTYILVLGLAVLAMLSLPLAGCNNGESNRPTKSPTEVDADPPTPVASPDTTEPKRTIAELRRQLKEKNPGFVGNFAKFERRAGEIRSAVLMRSDVTDISPLADLPLRELDLGFCAITDISVLKGMTLRVLILEDTKISDISVLKGMPLEILMLQNTDVSDVTPLTGMKLKELNLFGTKVEDISIVRDMPLRILWIPATKVDDLSPLQDKSLVSLDIQDTPVSDLSVLRGMTTLKRLNIAESMVTDLTPLKSLMLERLIFTPKQITQGIDVVRNMQSLNRLTDRQLQMRMGIGTSFDTVKAPGLFWKEFHAGEFR